MNLILFTSSFPYVRGGDANFLNVEVQHLVKEFDRVIVVPEFIKASKLPEHAALEVDTGYAELLASKSILDLSQLAFSSQILRYGYGEPNFPRLSFTAWRRLIAFCGKAELVRRWTLDFLRKQNLNPEECIFYTYWFDNAAAGIGMVKKDHPRLRLVSRAHNYDLYEEQYYDPPFFPCRNFTLNLVDRLFLCSFDGVEYMRAKYPQHVSRYQTSLLGVKDPGFITEASTDGVFRIVSCSFLRPEKRVDLLLEAFSLASRMRPGQRMEWRHIGNGEERAQLQKKADNILLESAKAFFIEYIDNRALMGFYRKNPVDVFVNVSRTEGIPVSIMEASSCGIPVVATAVGGNAEIVSEQNGILLDKDPSLDEIASAIFRMIDGPKESSKKRFGGRNVWKTQYNAHLNFLDFAQTLKHIRLRD